MKAQRSKNRILLKLLLASVFLHLLVFFLALFWRFFSPPVAPESNLSARIQIPIEIFDPHATTPKTQQSVHQQQKSRPSSKQEPPSSPTLAWAPPPGNRLGAVSQDHTVAQLGANQQLDAYAEATQIPLQEEANLRPFMTALWNKIHHELEYPKDFAAQFIQGKVVIELEVDERGVLSGKHIKVVSEEDYLKTYTLTKIYLALQKPLSSEYWLKTRKKLAISTESHFRVYGVGERAEVSHSERIYKNILSFELNAFQESKFNTWIRKVREHYFVFLPSNLGVMVDFISLYQVIQNIGKPTEDDLRQHRLFIEKERLDEVFRRIMRSPTPSPSV